MKTIKKISLVVLVCSILVVITGCDLFKKSDSGTMVESVKEPVGE